jgi:hypothetical protein
MRVAFHCSPGQGGRRRYPTADSCDPSSKSPLPNSKLQSRDRAPGTGRYPDGTRRQFLEASIGRVVHNPGPRQLVRMRADGISACSLSSLHIHPSRSLTSTARNRCKYVGVGLIWLAPMHICSVGWDNLDAFRSCLLLGYLRGMGEY